MEKTALLKEASLETLQICPPEWFGTDWFLLTAGTPDHFNTMTAGWGSIGKIWNMSSFQAYVRENRYTFEFMEDCDIFTASFFEPKYRQALMFCGSHSGRDCDKIKETGLTPVLVDNGGIAFEQAREVLVCRKVYADLLEADNFVDKDVFAQNYGGAENPVHKMYIGEILKYYTQA